MDKLLAKLFLLIELGMCMLVLFSFFFKDLIREPDISTISSHYNEPEYEIEQDYDDYLKEVDARLDASSYFAADDTASQKKETETVPALYKKKSDKNTSGLLKTIQKYKNIIESNTNANEIAGREVIATLKAYADRLFCLDVTNSIAGGQNDPDDNRDIIGMTEEGQLGWQQDAADISQEAANLIDFGLRMKEQGREFVILENPNKYVQIDGFHDYSEEKYQQLHSAYEEYGLDVIVAKDIWKQQGITEKEIFYNTDFHWKPSAGILADGLIASYLNTKGYSIDLSLFSLDSYEVEIAETPYLGYLGKKATLAYTEPEPFEIFTPRYETNVTAWNSVDHKAYTGSVLETVCWKEQLYPQNLYSGNLYAYYGLGDQGFIQIHNNLCDNGKRILVIKTSFANCMIPYLSSAVEDLDVVDLRLFDGSILKYVEKNDPDAVVVVYGLSSYENFTGKTKLFDFR